jgi:hypothetical protein
MKNVDITLKARLMGVTLRVVEDDDQVRRIVTIKLEHEFDTLIAETLGADAKTARESLINHGITEVKIPIDEIFARAKLEAGDAKIEIPQLRGLKAVGKVDVGQDEPPIISMSFECALSEKPWLFFGRNSHSWVDVTLTPLQTELPLPEDEADDKKKGKGKNGKRAAAKSNGHGHDDDAYVPPPGAAF